MNVRLTVLKLNSYLLPCLSSLLVFVYSTGTLRILMLHRCGISRNGTQVGAGIMTEPLVCMTLCRNILNVLSMLGIGWTYAGLIL